MEHEYQRAVTRLCVQTALLLLQHGAESTVVVQMAQRLGIALGVESVECALTANAVVLTTLSDNHCITTARKNTDKGINMQMVTDVQRIVIAVEHHLYDLEIAQRKLDQLKPLKYNRWLVVFMIGLSCAAFAHLSGGDWVICGITFVAAAIAMFVRQEFSKRHYNPLIVFSITSFVASLISGVSLKYNLGNDPQIALASSVLLLVPGFPLINSLADILKGYVNMGLGRWTIATITIFILKLFDDMLFAAIPAVGFALVFNVPPKALKYCAILAALGHVTRTLLLHINMPIVFATFFATCVIGFLGVHLSHRYLAHPKAFTVAAIIPMIPGVQAYKAMISMVQIHHFGFSDALFEQMISSFINTSFILGAIVFGLALPGLLFYRQKPVV